MPASASSGSAGGRGGGRGGKRGRVPRKVAHPAIARTRSSDRHLKMRMALARADTGCPEESFHGLTTERSDDVGNLHNLLRSLGGKIPGPRWASDVPHLRKKIAELQGQRGDAAGADDSAGGSDSDGGSDMKAEPTNKEIRELEGRISEGHLPFTLRGEAVEEVELRKEILSSASERGQLGQTVTRQLGKVQNLQDKFTVGKRKYDKMKSASNFKGEMLKAIRASLGLFVGDSEYLTTLQECFKLIINHRSQFEIKHAAETELKQTQAEYNAVQQDIQCKQRRVEDIKHKREQEMAAQRIGAPSRACGFGINDGSSTVTHQSNMDAGDDFNSLAIDGFDEEDEEEEEGGEAAAAVAVDSSTVSGGSDKSGEANDDEY